MKFNKTFSIGVGFLIIIVMIIAPLSRMSAATTVGSGATNSTSLSGIISDLSPLIKQLPGCTAALEGGVKNLFSGIKKLFSKSSKTAKYTDTDSLINTVEDAAAIAETVPINSVLGNKLSNEILVKTNLILGDTGDVKKSTASDNKNNTCLNDIGKAVIKQIVDKMTVSIVNWIQTGNGGDSFFVKDPSKFFKDIQKEQMLAFGQEMSDPNKFPFGKSFVAGMANSFNNKFQDNAQYSLNKVIQDQSGYTATDFSGDFSKGGWGAWDAMVQNPANNPLGFTLLASNELQKRIADQTTQKTNELLQSGGFLNMEKCADPEGVTKEEDESARNAGGRYLDAQGTSVAGGRYIDEQGTNTAARICKRWETVTPGGAIANELTKSMDNSKSALLSADTLNGAIAAILDAALAKLSATLTNEGLSSISEDDINQGYNTYDDGGLSAPEETQTDRDFSGYQRDASPWLQSHPDFDIRTDINQALIDEQRIYIDKLKQQNAILPDLIKTIYQLDYCIPGPHPGWKEDAQNELDKYMGQISGVSFEGIKGTTGYALLSTFTLGIGTAIIDWGNSAFECGDDGGKKTADYMTNALNLMTGISNVSPQEKLCSASGLEAVFDKIMEGYSANIERQYNLNTLPSVTREAETKFNMIPGYEKTIKDNEGAIAFQEGIIKRLQVIKTGISNLNINSATYESDLKAWKNSFARISTSLVSGGDIAHVDDLTNQAMDEYKYVHDDLLQGPAGCEKELQTTPIAPWQIAVQVRPDYPKPHLYDYPGPLNPSLYTGAKGFLTSVFIWDSWRCGLAFADNSCAPYANNPPHNWTGDIDVGGIINIDNPGFAADSAAVWERALKIY